MLKGLRFCFVSTQSHISTDYRNGYNNIAIFIALHFTYELIITSILVLNYFLLYYTQYRAQVFIKFLFFDYFFFYFN
jgi:hypothetical protein